MIERYLPSNGTEGEIFFDGWCRNCARDRSMRDGEPIDECDDTELCDIIARSFRGDVDEWVYGPNDEPMCSAFVPAGSPILEALRMTMDANELRALADAIVYRDSLSIARAADYLRACADAQPVAWRCEVRGDGTDPKLGAVDWRHYHTTTSEREAYRRAALVCKEIEDGWYGNDKTAGLAWECVVALEALGREE